MTITLIVVVAVATIVAVAFLTLYIRRVQQAMTKQITESEGRLRKDLIATRIVFGPPQATPQIPKPRTTRPFTVIKGGAVAVLGALTAAWLWTKQRAAFVAVAVGAGAALVIIPSATPLEPPASGPPVAVPGPTSTPPTRGPTEPPVAPPLTEPPPPFEPPPFDQPGSPPSTSPPGTQPEPATPPVEQPEPASPEAAPPEEPPPPTEPPTVTETCRRELDLQNVHLCIDPVPSVESLLE